MTKIKRRPRCIDIGESNESEPEEEILANAAASQFGVNNAELQGYMARVNPYAYKYLRDYKNIQYRHPTEAGKRRASERGAIRVSEFDEIRAHLGA